MAKSPDEILERHESSHKNTRRNVESETGSSGERQETRFVLVLRLVLYLIIFGALGGKFLTGSYLWEYDGKWIRLRTYFPPTQQLFTEAGLAKYGGNDPSKPIYVAIDGDVYDVTQGKAYQPGGPYHILAGVDAARAFGTGCFKTHRTHDLRGLSDSEIQGVKHWKQFYQNHKNYFKVGRVSHPPIDPTSPIPEGCDTKDKNNASVKKDTAERQAMVQNRNTHQEF